MAEDEELLNNILSHALYTLTSLKVPGQQFLTSDPRSSEMCLAFLGVAYNHYECRLVLGLLMFWHDRNPRINDDPGDTISEVIRYRRSTLHQNTGGVALYCQCIAQARGSAWPIDEVIRDRAHWYNEAWRWYAEWMQFMGTATDR